MTQIQSNPAVGLKMISQKRILVICNTSDQLLFQIQGAQTMMSLMQFGIFQFHVYYIAIF